MYLQGGLLHLGKQWDPYWKPHGRQSCPEKQSECSSDFTNFCTLGNVFFADESTMYIGCIP